MKQSSEQTWNDHVAERVKKLRIEHGWTQENLAHRIELLFGLSWTRATVTAIESARRDLLAIELIALITAFNCDVEAFVGPDAPEDNDDWLETAPDARVTIGVLRASFRGTPSTTIDGRDTPLIREVSDSIVSVQGTTRRPADIDEPTDTDLLDLARSPIGDAEQKAARKLDTTPDEISAAAFKLWGRSLTQERDARLIEDPTERRSAPAAKGHITRKLLTELGEELGRSEQ